MVHLDNKNSRSSMSASDAPVQSVLAWSRNIPLKITQIEVLMFNVFKNIYIFQVKFYIDPSELDLLFTFHITALVLQLYPLCNITIEVIIYQSICLPIHLSIYLYVYSSIDLNFYLSIYLYLSIPTIW